jgi:MerR family redox-sensitive transcriptional activator SoxR
MTEHELTFGELAERAGVAISALHLRTRGPDRQPPHAGNQRRYARDTLRRVAFIRMSQRVGIPWPGCARRWRRCLPTGSRPAGTGRGCPAGWRDDLEERILHLQRLRDNLADCIGCGCSSLAQLRCPIRPTCWPARDRDRSDFDRHRTSERTCDSLVSVSVQAHSSTTASAAAFGAAGRGSSCGPVGSTTPTPCSTN